MPEGIRSTCVVTDFGLPQESLDHGLVEEFLDQVEESRPRPIASRLKDVFEVDFRVSRLENHPNGCEQRVREVG